jgi:hypothetical protein
MLRRAETLMTAAAAIRVTMAIIRAKGRVDETAIQKPARTIERGTTGGATLTMTAITITIVGIIAITIMTTTATTAIAVTTIVTSSTIMITKTTTTPSIATVVVVVAVIIGGRPSEMRGTLSNTSKGIAMTIRT